MIVMTTRTVERQRTKCGQYWPDAVNGEPLDITVSPFVVNLLSEDKVRRKAGIEDRLEPCLSNSSPFCQTRICPSRNRQTAE